MQISQAHFTRTQSQLLVVKAAHQNNKGPRALRSFFVETGRDAGSIRDGGGDGKKGQSQWWGGGPAGAGKPFGRQEGGGGTIEQAQKIGEVGGARKKVEGRRGGYGEVEQEQEKQSPPPMSPHRPSSCSCTFVNKTPVCWPLKEIKAAPGTFCHFAMWGRCHIIPAADG